MGSLRAWFWKTLTIVVGLTIAVSGAVGESYLPWIKPEQRKISVRHPSQLPHIALPETPKPATVSDLQWDGPLREISLDDAIRTALANSEVIRVLGGATAVRSGSTIYDVAIANAAIDVAQGVFDPVFSVDNFWRHGETPGLPDPNDAFQSDVYDLDFALSKANLAGGIWTFGVTDDATRLQPGPFPLNPRESTSLAFRYDQPLLQGAGRAANQVPIVLARIDTERSYFQYKSSVQQLVRDVISAYWNLVSARTNLWAREQQVSQAAFALEQAEGQVRANQISPAEAAQPRVSLANFRATLIAAKADVLQAEAGLRSIMGLPPYDPQRITPVTPPNEQRLPLDWLSIVSLAEQYRPDIIELKLVLEADQQSLIQARNLALPQLDAVGVYSWNGLEGQLPVGTTVSSPLGDNTDWTLGVNFSVPLGLRASRAQLRQAQLVITRDRANLSQQLLTASHLLAASLRNLDQFFEQYGATRETRVAAKENLNYQLARYSNGLEQYINVLQAIVSWGDAVSSEAQLLTLYNIEQANLELETGTILETHDVFFYEERYASLGPLGCVGKTRCYPRAKPPTDNANLYPPGDKPSEEFFDLTDPVQDDRARQQKLRDLLPPLNPPPPSEPIEPFELEQPVGILPVPVNS
ncbi:MAG: TolC family protein [Planctomycetota bacterium]